MERQNSLLHPLVAQAVSNAHIRCKIIPCDPNLADTAAFCDAYGYDLEASANTIIVGSKVKDGAPRFAACLVLATTKLDVNKKVCQLMGVKKASFASMEDTVTVSSMEIGGVTIIGLTEIPLFIDSAVLEQPTVIVGGGNRSSKIIIDPKELLKLPRVQIVQELAKLKN